MVGKWGLATEVVEEFDFGGRKCAVEVAGQRSFHGVVVAVSSVAVPACSELVEEAAGATTVTTRETDAELPAVSVAV